MRVYGVGRVTELGLGPPRIRLRRRTAQYCSRSLGVGTVTIYDADMASQQSTPYGVLVWCVGSTLVRNSHSIPQEWREECTSGLFFASGTSGAGLCGAMAAERRHNVDDLRAIK